jgi:hypothetical protein
VKSVTKKGWALRITKGGAEGGMSHINAPFNLLISEAVFTTRIHALRYQERANLTNYTELIRVEVSIKEIPMVLPGSHKKKGVFDV